MVKILVGEQGEGKTTKLVGMANDAVELARGSIVFIDDNNSRMYEVNHKVRFVEIPSFVGNNADIFRGFIYGILSQNNSIERIYIDGLKNICSNLTDDGLVDFIEGLNNAMSKQSVYVVLVLFRDINTLPKALEDYLI